MDINFSLHFNFFSLYTWCYITLKTWNSKKYYKFQIILYKGKKKIHLSYQVWLFNNFILSLLLMKVKVKVLVSQSCPTLCDPMNCSLPGFPVHGILLARALEWVAVTFSRGSSWPRDQFWVSCIAGRFFTIKAIREVKIHCIFLSKYAYAYI